MSYKEASLVSFSSDKLIQFHGPLYYHFNNYIDVMEWWKRDVKLAGEKSEKYDIQVINLT